jgi:iron complex transport system ATP-binding protein
VTTAALIADGVELRTLRGSAILAAVTWTMRASERWALIGANGSGKTSLLRLASAQARPSAGSMTVLGERLGRTDMRELRRRIGVASAAVSEQLRPTLSAHDTVVTARHGALETWWHDYDPEDHTRADELLEMMGCGSLSERQLGTLSQGERQRVLLARALMPNPELLLMDEPAAGLDLPAREALVARLGDLARDPAAPPMVLVTHHVEEIPVGITHALLLRNGAAVAAGPIADTITDEVMSATFGLDVKVERRDGRWTAWASSA